MGTARTLEIYWDQQDSSNAGWAWRLEDGPSGAVEDAEDDEADPVEMARQVLEDECPEDGVVLVVRGVGGAEERLRAEIPSTGDLARDLLRHDLSHSGLAEIIEAIERAGGYESYVEGWALQSGQAGDRAMVLALDARGYDAVGRELERLIEEAPDAR